VENEVNMSNNKPIVSFPVFVAQYVPPSMYDGLDLTEEEVVAASQAPQGAGGAKDIIRSFPTTVYQRPDTFWQIAITGISIVLLILVGLSVSGLRRKNKSK
jgi:hypothetical protein